MLLGGVLFRLIICTPQLGTSTRTVKGGLWDFGRSVTPPGENLLMCLCVKVGANTGAGLEKQMKLWRCRLQWLIVRINRNQTIRDWNANRPQPTPPPRPFSTVPSSFTARTNCEGPRATADEMAWPSTVKGEDAGACGCGCGCWFWLWLW